MINACQVKRFKNCVVPVCQRSTARDDLASVVVANRLELPDATNQLEVANMQAIIGQHAAHAWAFGLELVLM